MSNASTLINATAPNNSEARWGWVQSGQDRGTLDIFWSCSVTIFLCCWVATHPNVGAKKDKFLKRIIDKTHLAVIGLLGPDFLFGIAIGQFSSAKRSVRKFKTDKVTNNGTKWTYTHAFFTDTSGILLTTPDFPEGFPINAEQLHWLVKHEHVDFPNMNDMNIGERNASDTLSRLLTTWQALWFCVIEIQRAKSGLPMTTLELTALSYVSVMLTTQVCWLKKPSIGRPRMVETKNKKKAEEIREWARNHTHRNLPQEWFRTPVDFIDGPRFQIDTHWLYYTRITHLMRLPILSRPMTSRPWDRFPSDIWIPVEKAWLMVPFGVFVLLIFSGWFLIGWNFFFPTEIEQYMWRVCAVVQAVFGIFGGCYYLVESFKWHAAYEKIQKQTSRPSSSTSMTSPARTTGKKGTSTEMTLLPLSENADSESQLQLGERGTRRTRRWRHMLPMWLMVRIDRVDKWLDRFRNISHDQDPQMAMPVHVIFSVTIICALLYGLSGVLLHRGLFIPPSPAGRCLCHGKSVCSLLG